MCVFMFVCVCVYMYIYMYTFVFIHFYTGVFSTSIFNIMKFSTKKNPSNYLTIKSLTRVTQVYVRMNK